MKSMNIGGEANLKLDEMIVDLDLPIPYDARIFIYSKDNKQELFAFWTAIDWWNHSETNHKGNAGTIKRKEALNPLSVHPFSSSQCILDEDKF